MLIRDREAVQKNGHNYSRVAILFYNRLIDWPYLIDYSSDLIKHKQKKLKFHRNNLLNKSDCK